MSIGGGLKGKNYCDSPLKLFRAKCTGEAFSNAAIVQKDALQHIAHTLFQLQKINRRKK